MIQVAAPSNLFADGYDADALRWRPYNYQKQNGFHSSVFDVHFSFNHGHPRTFRARVHRKNRSGYGDRAIRSTNIQVPGVTLRGLHNDAALIEMDGCIATAGADRLVCALTHFHLSSHEQPLLGTRIGGRANKFTLTDFVTEFQSPLASGANAIRLPFDGINPRACARRTREVPVATNPDRGNQHGHGCCREGQSDQAPLETTCARLHLPADGRRAINSAARRIRAARDTFPQVISYDECTNMRTFLPMKSREQRPNVSAATNKLDRAGCDFCAFACLQTLPHALCGHRQRLSVGLLGAKFGNRLLKVGVLLRSK